MSDGEISYDTLIVAAGSTHQYYGHDEWEKFAPPLKTIEHATAARARILLAFEAAEREQDPAKLRAWMTFVVVGGGPTGVELAGALAEIAHDTLKRDFRDIDPSQARILLIETTDRVLPPYPPALSESARKTLERLGVTVRTRATVLNIDEQRSHDSRERRNRGDSQPRFSGPPAFSARRWAVDSPKKPAAPSIEQAASLFSRTSPSQAIPKFS